ncbi:MAG: tetratricopeptide repeat protein [Rhodobacteraceae bacterium]|nr:tetratricopeptide repeat protein [Paracoccaceae bacterium]
MTETDALAQARAAHKAGQFKDAEAGYRAVLRADPNHGEALQLLGTLCQQQGRHGEAAAILSQAIERQGSTAETLFNLGLAHYGAGQYAQAVGVLADAAKLKPDWPTVYNTLGTAHMATGDTAAAVTAFGKAIALDGGYARAHYNLGVARQKSGDLSGAAENFARAIALDPNLSQAHANLAAIEDDGGDTDSAIRTYRAALKVSPNDVVTLNNLGRVLTRNGSLDEGAASYKKALTLEPNNPDVLLNYANCLVKMNQMAEAIEIYKKIIADDENTMNAHVNLGHLWRRGGQMTHAIAAYERAVDSGWPKAEGYLHTAMTLFDNALFPSAMVLYDAAIARDPKNPKYTFYLACAALCAGQFERGWPAYEARTEWLANKSGKNNAEIAGPGEQTKIAPAWNRQEIAGKRILVRREQGLGEEIMFALMIPQLLKLGAHVTLDIHPRLATVFARSFPEIEFLKDAAEGENAITQPDPFDYQIALGSLGQFFRRRFEEFPRHDGYIKADPEKVARLRAKYGELARGRRIVGVSWLSKRENLGELKSAPLKEWAEVLRAPGVMFVNLQYGDCGAELAEVKNALGVEIYQDSEVDPMGNLDDFVAQVAALDLVISTSNTTVHVAGALNVPCWVVLPHGMGLLWYWFFDRSDSPWYPSLKIYRQPRPEYTFADEELLIDWWRAPLERISADLSVWAAESNESPRQPA